LIINPIGLGLANDKLRLNINLPFEMERFHHNHLLMVIKCLPPLQWTSNDVWCSNGPTSSGERERKRERETRKRDRGDAHGSRAIVLAWDRSGTERGKKESERERKSEMIQTPYLSQGGRWSRFVGQEGSTDTSGELRAVAAEIITSSVRLGSGWSIVFSPTREGGADVDDDEE
jgi:hypothetical protein